MRPPTRADEPARGRVDTRPDASHAERVFATERQQRILQQVRLEGSVRVAELVTQLDVSDMTVRRDIASLAEQGLVTRVHGGATAGTRGAGALASGTLAPGIVDPQERPDSAERAATCALAASFVEPGSTVILSGGPMAMELARVLGGVPRLTVVTNSQSAADVLHSVDGADLTVALTGGQRTADGTLVGSVAAASLRDLRADWAILGARGMDVQAGVTVPTAHEADIERSMMTAAAGVMFVVESSRWQTVDLQTVTSLEEIDLLVTDTGLRAAARSVLEATVGRLAVAQV